MTLHTLGCISYGLVKRAAAASVDQINHHSYSNHWIVKTVYKKCHLSNQVKIKIPPICKYKNYYYIYLNMNFILEIIVLCFSKQGFYSNKMGFESVLWYKCCCITSGCRSCDTQTKGDMSKPICLIQYKVCMIVLPTCSHIWCLDLCTITRTNECSIYLWRTHELFLCRDIWWVWRMSRISYQNNICSPKRGWTQVCFSFYFILYIWCWFHGFFVGLPGFPCYLENLENLEFVICFSRHGKCLEFAEKVGKTWNFNSKPGQNVKFVNLMFPGSHFKMSFTEKNSFTSMSYLHYQHKQWLEEN